MKGQLTLEYMVSFAIFIGIIGYIYLSYTRNVPSFLEDVRKEDIRAQAYQLSEILVNDVGEPVGWTASSVARVGLNDEGFNQTNLISNRKITELKNNFDCTNPAKYKDLQNKLGFSKQFSFVISDVDSTTSNRQTLYSCTPTAFARGVVVATVKRITAYNDGGTIKLAELIVQV